jgi:L-arabinose isomerase
MTIFDNYEVWFVIGSQHLYGPEACAGDEACGACGERLNAEAKLPCKLVLKPLGTTPDEITHICRDANYDDKCAGLVVWLHTFSPAKMWINGLTILNKPLLQFHTQFNAAAVGQHRYGLYEPEPDRARRPRVRLHRRAYAPAARVVTGHWQDGKAHSVSAPGCVRRSLSRIPAI